MPPGDKIGPVVRSSRPRFVDTGNPALAVECPRCGLLTPRFLPYCRNCSFGLWPDRAMAGTAFEAWQRADPARAMARPFVAGGGHGQLHVERPGHRPRRRRLRGA